MQKNIVNLKECVAAIVFYNRKRVIHQIGDWNWNCELTLYLSNTFQIHCIYAMHGCKCDLKKKLYTLSNGLPHYFCDIKKYCTLKKLVPATKRINL